MSAQEFNAYVLTFFCLHFTIPYTGVINSLEELCIMQVVTVNSFAKVLNLLGSIFWQKVILQTSLVKGHGS